MTPLRSFMEARRIHGQSSDWNVTGLPQSPDFGKYKISEEQYDAFLTVVHGHTFGNRPLSNTLLEKHKDVSPIIVDLDFLYDLGATLHRRFTHEQVRKFVAEYIAALIYFYKVEGLEKDLVFYDMVKPQPEVDVGKGHKDGIHIQGIGIATTPKLQFGIRGYLLQRDITTRLFPPHNKPAEKCYDVAVIKNNNWFLYGSSKPNKAQYMINHIWKISISDVRDMLDGEEAPDMADLAECVESYLTDCAIPTDTLELMKTLSIRRGYDVATPIELRPARTAEWEELMISWGSGKEKMDRGLPAPAPRNVIEHSVEGGDVAEGIASSADAEVASTDIALAYALSRECIDVEKRLGSYQNWINYAIMLKNVANNEESCGVWIELTHRLDPSHKKASKTEAELRSKWAVIRANSNEHKLTIRSLMHWAEEDNPAKLRSILSNNHQWWIVQKANNTHVSVATLTHSLFKWEFACSVTGKRGSFEWYYYPPKTHSWRSLKSPVELRARLSGRVRNEYSKAIRELRRMIENTNDDESNLQKAHISDETSDAIKKLMDAGLTRNLAEKTVFEMNRVKNKDEEKKKKPSQYEEQRKTLEGIERQLENSGFKDAVLKEAGEMFYEEDFLNRLNCNPYLVGCSNGVLDLQHYAHDPATGQLATKPSVLFRPGIPDDNISFQMGRSEPDLDAIPYVPWADIPQEEKDFLTLFFTLIYPNEELREFVIILLSSCLEGQNKEQRFYVNQGEGSNGKSMIQILMEFVFGDYQTSLQTTVLTRKRPESGAANPDMITTKCKRYIYMGEPDPGEKLNSSRMKQLSGEDRIEARALFGDQEKFTMMGKLFLSCNDKPEISSMDNGTWRRIRVIPHISTFKDPGDPAINPAKHIYEKDLHLKTKLRAHRVAFFSMLVHYYETKYLVTGLREPEIVMSASNKYKEENDVFMRFFAESFVKEDGAVPVDVKVVKAQFRAWKKANVGLRVDLKEQQVFERMRMVSGQGSTDKIFYGIRVSEEAMDLSGASFLSHMP
jgi:P4 family phage/plasmid primase-like protien